MEKPDYLTLEELAAYLKVSLGWVNQRSRLGQLPGQVKVGRGIRIHRETMEVAILNGELELKSG